MGGWLQNTDEAARAINNSLYLLRPLRVTVCMFRLSSTSQLRYIMTIYSYICLHFFKCWFAEVKITFLSRCRVGVKQHM